MQSIKDILNSGKTPNKNEVSLRRLKELAAEQMKRNGYHEVTKQCHSCNDLGWVLVDVPYTHPDFNKAVPCPNPDCSKRREILENRQNALMKTAQIPDEYKHMTLDSWYAAVDQSGAWEGKRLAYAAARLYLENRNVSLGAAYELAGRKWEYGESVRNSLIFQGDYGTGKTGLATGLCNALIEQGLNVLYVRALDFIGEVYSRYNNKNASPSADSVIEMAKTAELLFLDDFNISNDTDNRKDIMETVIRHRHNNGLPTLVTCNQTRLELAETWGKRTVDVLLAMAHMIPMGGIPLRDTRQINDEDVF